MSSIDNTIQCAVGDEQLARRINELFHDLQSGQFDTVHQHRHKIESRFWLEEVVPRLQAGGVSCGVDLCSGTGFVPKVLLRKLSPPATIRGLDLSAKALEQATDRLGTLGNRFEAHPGDVHHLPFEDASADWVSLNAGLHHVPDPGRVLSEVDRILKPGGLFCLGYEPNLAFFSSKCMTKFEKTLWYLFWYLSPKRNWQRLRRMTGGGQTGQLDVEHLDVVNRQLKQEKLIDQPLTREQLRRIIDPHTHDDGALHAGFDAYSLIDNYFGSYKTEVVQFADYGGEMLRMHCRLRTLIDGLFARLFPKKGMLFSLIVRKPKS